MSHFSSGRPCRLKSSRYLKKERESNSPTLSSSHSSRSLWARSYKNEPIPAQLRKRLIGKKYQFDDIDDSSSQDQQIMAVLEEEQQQQIEEKFRLPKFKVMSDCDEFSDTKRYRMSNEKKQRYSPQKCHSVTSLKLPQVIEEKKEEEDNKNRKKVLAKIQQFRDNNEFGLNHNRISSCEPSEIRSRAESMQLPKTSKFMQGLPDQIVENQAEETKSLKIHHDKSMLTAELDRLIVDEVDDKVKKRKQESQQEIIAIQEEKVEEEVDTAKLSDLLGKFEEQLTTLQTINDQQNFSRQDFNQNLIDPQHSDNLR